MPSISAGNREKPLEAASSPEVALSLCENKLCYECAINALLMLRAPSPAGTQLPMQDIAQPSCLPDMDAPENVSV